MKTVFQATPEERKENIQNTISLMHEEFRNVGETSTDIPGIPLAPSIKNSKPGAIFVLEKASLVPAYVGRTYEILNPDKHADFMRKKNMIPYDYRPDIIYEVLLKQHVKTDQGFLIRIEPHINIPPTPGKFCSLMCKSSFFDQFHSKAFTLVCSHLHYSRTTAQLLQKFSIKARGKGEKLMRLIENPLDKHLLLNSLKIGLSFSSSRAVNLRDYVTTINNDCTLVFIVWSLSTD